MLKKKKSKNKLTLDELASQLVIVDENIKNEALRQPSLFMRAARYRVAKMRATAAAKSSLEAQYAAIGLHIRTKLKKIRQERVLEGEIKARILGNPGIKILQDAVQQAEWSEELSKLLLEGMRMKRDAIRIVAEMQSYEGLRETSEIERISQNRKLENKARDLHRRRLLKRRGIRSIHNNE